MGQREWTESEILAQTRRAVGASRKAEAKALRWLGVVDNRRLYRLEGVNSFIQYLVQRLGYSYQAGYKRIAVVRLARRVPAVLEAFGAGLVHLSGLELLAPVLSPDNAKELLGQAAGKTKREIDVMVKVMRPQSLRVAKRTVIRPLGLSPEVAATGLKLDQNKPTLPRPPQPTTREVLHRLAVTISSTFVEKLDRAKDLMSHRVPSGDTASILEAALDMLIERVDKERFGSPTPRNTAEPTRRTRAIPAQIRRAVADRDNGQCTYTDTENRRCECRQVEFHHLHPFAKGGEHTKSNLTLRCRAHNQLAAEEDYGPKAMTFWSR